MALSKFTYWRKNCRDGESRLMLFVPLPIDTLGYASV